MRRGDARHINLRMNSGDSSKAAIQKIVDGIQERFRSGASLNDPLVHQPDGFPWQVRHSGKYDDGNEGVDLFQSEGDVSSLHS